MIDPPEGLTIRFDGKSPVFTTLRGPLEQVLRNLIGNAVHHHDRDQGEIVVSALDRGEFWEWAVRDDGPGISQEARASILDVARAPDASDSLTGSGMGLPLVQRIVQGLGGRLEFGASGDRGAEIRFTWPKQIAQEAQPE